MGDFVHFQICPICSIDKHFSSQTWKVKVWIRWMLERYNQFRSKLEGQNLNLSEIIYEFLKFQHTSHRIDLNWLYLSNIHLIHTFTFQVWEEKCLSIEQIGQIWKCTKSPIDTV
jgi:hypothetical protein